MKIHYYIGKANVTQIGLENVQDAYYGEALKFLNWCTRDEIDPEVHELYSGNAFFEIAKVFLR